MLPDLELALGILEVAPHAVQVNGVRHHRVVDEHDPHAFAIRQPNGLGTGKLDAVERPGESLHVSGQVQFDRARRLPTVGIIEDAREVRVGQNASPVLPEANSRVIELRRRRHRLHVDEGVALLGGRMRLHRAAHGGHIVPGVRIRRRRRCLRHRMTRVGVRSGGHRRRRGRHRMARVRIGGGGRGSRHSVAGVGVRGCGRHWGRRGRFHRSHVVPHSAVTHVGHRQDRPRIQGGHRRRQSRARRERAGGESGAIHRLREDREGVLAGGLDDHVEGLSHGDAELVDGYRPYWQAVGGHDGHLQPGDPHVEVRHSGTVDEAEPDLLARREQPRPVAGGRAAVHQVGIGVAGHVGEVRGAHAHLPPHPPFLEGGTEPLLAHVLEERGQRALAEVVVIRLLLQLLEDASRALVRPVREHDDVFAIERNRIGLARLDHERSVDALLLLEARVAVVPVGARLLHRELIAVRLARMDAREAEAGHAVHVGGQQDAVPVNRRVLVKAVRDVQGDGVPLPPPQQRPR